MDTADPVAVTKSLSLFKSHVPQSPDILIVHWVNLANTSKNENGNTFVLAFNGTGAYTSQIDNMYGSNGDATIQVRFAANSDTGLIMAYYKGSSVAIYLNKTVHLLKLVLEG
jgi:hypothetical protein